MFVRDDGSGLLLQDFPQTVDESAFATLLNAVQPRAVTQAPTSAPTKKVEDDDDDDETVFLIGIIIISVVGLSGLVLLAGPIGFGWWGGTAARGEFIEMKLLKDSF